MGAAFAEPVQTVTHEDGLEVVDISVRGDGNVVAVGYANGGVSLYARGASVQWDTHKRKELPTPGLDAGVTHRHAPVCFAPDGSFLATGHHGSIVVWPRASSIDYANERAVRLDLKGAGADGGRVSETAASLAVAQVGEAQFIAAGLVHSAVCIWSRGRDADTFAQVSKQTLVASGPGPVTSVSFSVDGKFLAAAHNMHLVLFQRASHGTWHLRFTSKGGLMVRAVAFSRVPGATTLAVAWRTGVVGLLHVTDRGDEAPSVRSYQSLTPGAGHAHDDDLYCVDVARNGKAIVAGGQGRTLVWTLGETGNMNCDAAFELRGKPLAGASMRAVAFHGDRFAMSACAWGRAPVCVYDMAAAGSLPDPTVFVCNDIPASAEAALPYVLKAFPRSGEPGDGATLVTPIVRQVRSFASAFDEARAHLKSTPSPQMIIIFHNQQDPKRGEITTRGSLFRDTWPKVEELREWWANETDGIFSRRRKYECECHGLRPPHAAQLCVSATRRSFCVSAAGLSSRTRCELTLCCAFVRVVALARVRVTWRQTRCPFASSWYSRTSPPNTVTMQWKICWRATPS